MNKPKRLTRRKLIQDASRLGLAGSLTSFTPIGYPIPEKENIIQRENKQSGTTDWQLTRVRVDQKGYRSPWIEGYCSKQSVKAGETIEFKISTEPKEKFRLEIFRTGYYGGCGARLMKTMGPFQGEYQNVPKPGHKNIHECDWKTTAQLTIPDDWVSGVYLGRLTTLPNDSKAPYWQSYLIFVVTDNRPADVLFQCSDNTWQAYNKWPSNYSVYTDPKGMQGPWANVSFDRPYGRQSQHDAIVNDPLSVGSGEFISFEQPLSYFLEQHGYDVAYCSNSDMLTPDRGLRCKAFLSVGHDEYWDIRQYNSVVKMKNEGVNLLFFSGNAVCWVTPMTPNSKGVANRTMFRGGPYGADNDYAKLREKLNGPFPERGPDEGLLMGCRNIEPVNGGGDWTVEKGDHWIFEGTGMKTGDSIPGLVGWEYHGFPATEIPGLEIVAGGNVWVGGEQLQRWDSVFYPGPKNNFIFNASTIFWAQGLSTPPGHTLPWSHWSRPHGPDERVQRITHNLLKKAINPTKN